MKKLQFKTGKGDFILLDMPFFYGNVTDPYPTVIDWNLTTLSVQDIDTGNYILAIDFDKPVDFIGYVGRMTREQISHVVDSKIHKGDNMYMDYCQGKYVTGINRPEWSFKSIIESKGFYLFRNPVQKNIMFLPDEHKHRRQMDKDWIDAENNTFFNPILLKKL